MEFMKSNHHACLEVDTSATSALMQEEQQRNSKDFNRLEDIGMTSAGRGKFSTDFKAQSNETSAPNHSLHRSFSLTLANQEDETSVSEISDPLQVTEPRSRVLKPDLEIPHRAKITSIPLSFFPSKLQQLLLAAAKSVSEVGHTTETQSVIYVWPLIKTDESSSSFRHTLPKPLISSSPNLTRHCLSPDVTEDEKCSQITPVKELAQEKPGGKTARSYPLIVKSSNRLVSKILKSLTNIKNKDKNKLTLSCISPIREQLKMPFFKGNALMIYNGQVYLLYVRRHEDLATEMEAAGRRMLLVKTLVWLISCRSVHQLTLRVSCPLLLREDAMKWNMKCLTASVSPTPQRKISNETHFSSHKVAVISQPKNCSAFTGKRQPAVTYDDQFLNKTVFPSKEGLQRRNYEEARQDKDNEIRKKFGLVKGVRVVLNRLSPSEPRKQTVKASALKKGVNH